MIDILLEIFFIMILIFLNFDLHIRFLKKYDFSKNFELLLCSFGLIFLSFCFWGNLKDLFPIYIVLFVLSYIDLCIAHKKNWNKIVYTFLFIFFSAFFVIWITVMFGKYYYDNKLIDITIYAKQIKTLNNRYRWYLFTIYDYHLSKIFFDIGFEKYFVFPNQISLYNIQFVQFLVGIIINGTIIFSFFDLIKGIIIPNLNHRIESNVECLQVEISSVKLFSVGVNKIFTNRFYRAMNKKIGAEITIKNNTTQTQKVKMGIYIYKKNNIISMWEEYKNICHNNSILCEYTVDEKEFSEMQDGRYKILFLVNNKIMRKEHFKVLYK